MLLRNSAILKILAARLPFLLNAKMTMSGSSTSMEVRSGCAGTHTEQASEVSGKVAVIRESDSECNLRQRQIGLRQQLFGPCNSAPQDVLVWRLSQ